ncbi:hypothetical protein [Aeromicrobium sp. 9AM]|uniref:hypothetical protein n=1 Tax=Aeromicrobium sp. 9AM TaxID=2653126 RepID=UPI0012F25E47|nr:hypothetical protein [Aeromicrobium sp. 9AM]VXB53959.1 hypothetical protein AERO9AM_20270 [Aeromicrobium sp. 9AM]
MSGVHPDGLGGPRTLVVASSPVELDDFRKRRYDQMVVVHARADGTFDPRVLPPFQRALVFADAADATAIRVAADYAAGRLGAGGIIEFVDPANNPEAAVGTIAAALPHMEVTVTALPAPARVRVVEAVPRPPARPSLLQRLRGRR